MVHHIMKCNAIVILYICIVYFFGILSREIQVFKLTNYFLGGSVGKKSAHNAGDLDLIPGLGRSPGGGHGNLLQYSCLENPMGRGACQATVL